MPSMEELNNLDEITASNNNWGIDKKIPLTLIVVVIFQTMAVTWGAATLSNEVKNYGEKIIKLERDFEKFEEKSEVKFEMKERHEVDKNTTRRELDDIKAEITSLGVRIRSIEKTIN